MSDGGETVETSEERERMIRQFYEAVPHAQALGMRIVDLSASGAGMEMPYDAALVGDPATGVLHGGAISALMDTCCSAAVLMHPSAPATTATLDLRIDYMRAATPGQGVRARAECYHVTRSVAFVRAQALDDGEGPVAAATGAFTLAWSGETA